MLYVTVWSTELQENKVLPLMLLISPVQLRTVVTFAYCVRFRCIIPFRKGISIFYTIEKWRCQSFICVWARLDPQTATWRFCRIFGRIFFFCHNSGFIFYFNFSAIYFNYCYYICLMWFSCHAILTLVF